MTKTETKTEIDLPPAPPVAEIAWLEAEPHPLDNAVVFDTALDYGPGYHAGWYVLRSRATRPDGSEVVELDYSRANRDDDGPFALFAPPPPPPPFTVPASRIRETRKFTWYSPTPVFGQPLFYRDWDLFRNLFGSELVDAELARIERLGATIEERRIAWIAERNAFLEAGLIPE